MSKGRKTVEQKLESATEIIKTLVWEVKQERRKSRFWAMLAKCEREHAEEHERGVAIRDALVKALIVEMGVTKEAPFSITQHELVRISREIQVIADTDRNGISLYPDEGVMLDEPNLSAEASGTSRKAAD